MKDIKRFLLLAFPFFLLSTSGERGEGTTGVFSSGRDTSWSLKKMVLLIWAKRNMTSLPRDATMNTHEEVK